ncbi:MAG: RnfH family protein [Salinisphaeraceae bacterium]|nr:RnfH family protein [Salinisphaeraceae bacterium]
MAEELIRVEVAYARPDEQAILTVDVPQGAQVREAIERSGILDRFPEINLDAAKVGIFGKAMPMTQPLKAGDRVEIYRPLIADPKESRRNRAKAQKA